MNYQQTTYFYNFDHPQVAGFVSQNTDPSISKKENAVRLFYAIRDGWEYRAEQIFFKKEKWRASEILQRPKGHCLDKANLLITCLRAIGIPARLHLVKVKNHIAAEKVMERFKTDELTPHAFAEVFLEGKWVAATPTFNKELCEKLNVDPLEWDGGSDALFQQFSRSGNQFMEYLDDYGVFEDLPFEFVFENMFAHYPMLAADGRRQTGASLNQWNSEV